MRRSRLLPATLLAVALLGPAAAYADRLTSQARFGSATSSREHTGACTIVSSYRYRHDLLLSCRPNGEASATYSFTLAGKTYGTVAYAVSKALVRGPVQTRIQVVHGRVRVRVTVGGGGRIDVRSVSISYYTH